MNSQRKSAFVGALVSLSLLAACNEANNSGTTTSAVNTELTIGRVAADPRELAAFQAATRQLYDLKQRAFAEGNMNPIINRFYAENAMSIGPEGEAYSGRAAYRANYAPLIGRYDARIEPVRSYVSGDTGWEWANFRVLPRDPAERPWTFAILFLWTKVNGQWVCAGDEYVVGELPNGPAQ